MQTRSNERGAASTAPMKRWKRIVALVMLWFFRLVFWSYVLLYVLSLLGIGLGGWNNMPPGHPDREDWFLTMIVIAYLFFVEHGFDLLRGQRRSAASAQQQQQKGERDGNAQ